MDPSPGWLEQVFSTYSLSDPLPSRHLGFATVKFKSSAYPITFYEIFKPSRIVFSIHHSHLSPSSSTQYYQFPHEAIVEAIYSPSLDVLVSFHLPKDANLSVLHSACACKTEQQKNTLSFSSKLEEFANVCTRPKRRLTDPGLLISPFVHPKSDCYAINIGLSGVNESLLSALKQNVLNFETRYEKMIELMKLHCQQVTAQKMMGPLDTEKTEWSSDEEVLMNEIEQVEEEIPTKGNNKQCSYCGSKSTPMWRRGPEGAGTLCNACGVKWKHGKILCGGTEYFPPPPPPPPSVFKKREKKRKYKKEPKSGKRAAATAAAAAIVAGNKYGSDLDVLLNSSDEEHHHRRRHTTDISMIQTYGFNHPFDAGVDAVEAAAVLTLLKRS